MDSSALEDIHRSIDKLEAKVRYLQRSGVEESGDPIRLAGQTMGIQEPLNIGPSALPFERAAQSRPTLSDLILRNDLISKTARPATVELKQGHLLSQKIVTFDGADPRSRSYDMLRTQVSQAMNRNGWKVVGVTSPTPKCGKTLTAVNLAFSMARQPDQDVLLADMDLRQPQIAKYLGITPSNGGFLDLLKSRAALESSIVTVRAGQKSILVLPTAGAEDSSGLMGSQVTETLLNEMRKCYPTRLMVLNLPPMLTSDDVLTILPHLDCVVLVAAVGSSKIAEIEECTRYLRTSHLLRLVVNKAGNDDLYH